MVSLPGIITDNARGMFHCWDICLPENAKTRDQEILSLVQKNKQAKHRHSLPEGLYEVEISELMEVNEGLKNFDVKVVPAEQQQKNHSYKWQTQKEKKDVRYFETKHLSPR